MKNKRTVESSHIGYYKNKILNRKDGPAIIWYDGEVNWIKNGKDHRNKGPSFICSENGTPQIWRKNEQHHRDKGPSFISQSGKQYWDKNVIS